MNSLQFETTSYVDMNANKSLLTGVVCSSDPPSSTSPGPSPVCLHCYQWLQPDNHRVRLRPKPRPSQYVQSVLRRNARGKRLSLVQKNLLRRFQTASSALVRRHHTSATSVWADWPSTHSLHTLLPSFYLILSFIYCGVLKSRGVKLPCFYIFFFHFAVEMTPFQLVSGCPLQIGSFSLSSSKKQGQISKFILVIVLISLFR